MPTIREVALRKDGHTYLFRADGESHRALLSVLRRFALRPELNFSWHDAAVVCRKFREPSASRVFAPLPTLSDRLRK
jgi:hypothetical protein